MWEVIHTQEIKMSLDSIIVGEGGLVLHFFPYTFCHTVRGNIIKTCSRRLEDVSWLKTCYYKNAKLNFKAMWTFVDVC